MTLRQLKDFRICNFASAASFLGQKDKRLVTHNTWLVRDGFDEIKVRFHNTYIVWFHRDGRVFFTPGGYKTSTTKGRINMFLPRECGLHQKNFEWFFTRRQNNVTRLVQMWDVVEFRPEGVETITPSCAFSF